MRDVAKAAQHRSLKLFEKATKDHPHGLFFYFIFHFLKKRNLFPNKLILYCSS